MRRFEFVEGSSAKFWMGDVEGQNFIVVYGKLGTAGQRKEKAFPSEAAARKELEKKIAEKVKEGYRETTGGASTAPPPAAPKAPKTPPKLELPPRLQVVKPTAEAVAAAITALSQLKAEIGKRSWAVARQARRARRALEAIAGYNPASPPNMAEAFDSLMALVSVPKGAKRLPLRLAMGLIVELDISAFERALAIWQSAPEGAPALKALKALARQREELEDPELALRVGALLADRPDLSSSEVGFSRRWRVLLPHVEVILKRKGVTLKGYLKGIDTQGDVHLARRVARIGQS